MITLAIDTSSAISSVALIEDGHVLAGREHRDGRRHAETLAPMIVELLQECGQPAITNIACGVGPGPYTGVRAGIATAQAFGLARRIDVVGICSLDALAYDVHQEEKPDSEFTVMIDAKRAEVYWATYDGFGQRLTGPHIHPVASIQGYGPPDWFPSASAVGVIAQRFIALGNVVTAPEISLSIHGTDDGATADALRGLTLLNPAPLYVRRPDVTI